MTKTVVIVESPAKAKTISGYLGSGYTVLSSKGHVRNLIPKKGAVDPDNQFKMQYSAIADSAQYVKKIIQALSKADTLLLATDPDREGEAIARHLHGTEIISRLNTKTFSNKCTQRLTYWNDRPFQTTTTPGSQC